MTPVCRKSWYDLHTVLKCDRLKLVIMGRFCPLTYPPPPLSKKKKKKTQKLRALKNWKNLLEIIIIILQQMYQKPQSYEIRFLRYGVRLIIFAILGHFLPFYPPNNTKNQIFEKMKEAPGDVIILYMHTTNHGPMMYAFWDMQCDRQSFVILVYILPFSPTIDPEN